MGLLLIKAFKPSMNSNRWGIFTSIRRSRTRTELLANLGANLGKQCLQGVLNGRRKTMGTYDDEAGSSRSKHSRQHETMEEVFLPQVHHKFLLWEVCKRDAKSRIGCDGEIDDMLRIRLCEAGSDEEIFTSMAWIRAFNINEPIYAELCQEFYSTYEFNKVCADDELQTKKIFKFRLGGHYWLSISREENLGLSRSHTSTIRNPILRVIHKMITYGLCQRTTGYDKIQKNDI
nr:hypothetical protein [Tanacetum cinerariifolium]